MSAKKNPLEFYDEELSRTIRQIQELEMEGKDATRLYMNCDVYLQQMAVVVRRMKSSSSEKKQWQEVLQFREDALRQLRGEPRKQRRQPIMEWLFGN